MNDYSKNNNSIIKIGNPQGFIKDLLNMLNSDGKDK